MDNRPLDPQDPEDPPCSRGSVVGVSNGYLKALPATCRRWGCADCGHRNARRLAARIAGSDAKRFITLTARAQPDRDLHEFLDELNAAWRDLWKRLQRLHGQHLGGYVKVIEMTKNGTPHLHIAADIPYTSQRWLQAAWSALTGYFIVDIRRIQSEAQLARYLSKYLTKTHTAVVGRRKWSASRDFLPAVVSQSNDPEGHPVRWSYHFGGTGSLLESLRSGGWVLHEGWWCRRPPNGGVP